MKTIAELESRQHTKTIIGLDEGDLRSLAEVRGADVYITATEDGYSPLGFNLPFLSSDLGIEETEIRKLAHWNRSENQQVSFVAIPSRRSDGLLRGVILAASEASECYKSLARIAHGRPFRDFYYSVTFESIAYASRVWGARRIALSHLSAGGNRFHEDIATCNAEALAHYCDDNPDLPIESLTFLGCCITETHLAGIARLNKEREVSGHRRISTVIERHDGRDIVSLSWG